MSLKRAVHIFEDVAGFVIIVQRVRPFKKRSKLPIIDFLIQFYKNATENPVL